MRCAVCTTRWRWVFDYDHDPNFVPSADQLVLFEMLHKQIVGYSAMSLIIVKEMRERFAESCKGGHT
jgi:hypothetical protein